MKSGLKSTMEFLESKDFGRIHEASLKILKETGIVFQDDNAVELFKKHGAKTNGQCVYINEELVNAAVKNLKRTYVFNARNPKNDVVVGEDFLVQPNAGAVYIQDIDNGRRLATIEDYGNIMRLAQASDVVNLIGAHPVNPSDVPDEYKHLYMCYEIVSNGDKPTLGWCMTGKNSREYLDMLEISLGETPGALIDKQYANVSVNPLSPLSWGKDTIETIMEYSRRGQA
ncbi:MAG: trimethylamine methyltransferase family protein, partial [Clostridiales bacterium]